jgi:hypothetical protein
MKIEPDMSKTIAFVCTKDKDGIIVPRGTAFFVGHSVRFKVQIYVVTAKHILEQIQFKNPSSKLVLTFNSEEKLEELEIPLEHWSRHPDDAGEYVDVAIARFNSKSEQPDKPTFKNRWNVRCWMSESLITLGGTQQALGPGLEVGLTGLFVHHKGTGRNTPIVRVGNIAAMPQENVKTSIGPVAALLVEVRSVGGLSGSPVFTILPGGGVWLLGLVHGHFDQRTSDPDSALKDADLQQERINAGIAIVVPADKIRETLKPLIDSDFYGAEAAL